MARNPRRWHVTTCLRNLRIMLSTLLRIIVLLSLSFFIRFHSSYALQVDSRSRWAHSGQAGIESDVRNPWDLIEWVLFQVSNHCINHWSQYRYSRNHCTEKAKWLPVSPAQPAGPLVNSNQRTRFSCFVISKRDFAPSPGEEKQSFVRQTTWLLWQKL